MKRITLFELLIFVVFSDLSVATPPPMLSGGGSSSSAAQYIQTRPAGATMHKPASITITKLNNDPTEFEYSLATSTGEPVSRINGRNTDLEFYFGAKMKIRAKDNNNVAYSLDFAVPDEANKVADRIIGLDSERYQKCEGRNNFKIDAVYVRHPRTGHLFGLGTNWCCYKIRKTTGTMFMIRRLAPTERHRTVLGLFPSNECRLVPFVPVPGSSVPDMDHKFDLRVSLGGAIVDPKYVLESFSQDRMRAFFN